MKEKFDIYVFIPNSTKETRVKYNILLFTVYVPTQIKITLQRK